MIHVTPQFDTRSNHTVCLNVTFKIEIVSLWRLKVTWMRLRARLNIEPTLLYYCMRIQLNLTTGNDDQFTGVVFRETFPTSFPSNELDVYALQSISDPYRIPRGMELD